MNVFKYSIKCILLVNIIFDIGQNQNKWMRKTLKFKSICKTYIKVINLLMLINYDSFSLINHKYYIKHLNCKMFLLFLVRNFLGILIFVNIFSKRLMIYLAKDQNLYVLIC